MQFQHSAIAVEIERLLCEGSTPRPFLMFLGVASIRVLNPKDILIEDTVKVPLVIQGTTNIRDARKFIKPGMKLLINYSLAGARSVTDGTTLAPASLVLLVQSLTPVPGGLSNVRL